MTIERQAPQREAYMQELRNQAFIKVSDTYRDSVEPLIKVANSSAAKTSEKDSDKKKNSKKP
jgi:hypothetical protein